MLVKCISNRILSVGDELRAELRNSYHLPEGRVHLTIDNLYVVYAILIRNSFPSYFVADDDFSALHYPISYSAAFFQVVDARLSRHWHIHQEPTELKSVANEAETLLITFPEWERDSTFYERLVDFDDSVVAQFNRMKSLMDVEFPHPSVTLTAIGYVAVSEMQPCLGEQFA